jgi:hypothetical protein
LYTKTAEETIQNNIEYLESEVTEWIDITDINTSLYVIKAIKNTVRVQIF